MCEELVSFGSLHRNAGGLICSVFDKSVPNAGIDRSCRVSLSKAKL